jgi:hypothetical protein
LQEQELQKDIIEARELYGPRRRHREGKKISKSLLIVAFDVGCESVRAREIA